MHMLCANTRLSTEYIVLNQKFEICLEHPNGHSKYTVGPSLSGAQGTSQ